VKVTPEQLAKLIVDNLTDYTDEVREIVEETIDSVTKETLQAIKDSADIQHLKSFKYYKSFRIRDIYKARGKNKGYYKLVIANDQYRITHLLENGHAKSNGGRTRSFKHWINGQDVADTLPERIEVALKNAGS
jgi:serine/threonine-protein kinase RIO1